MTQATFVGFKARGMGFDDAHLTILYTGKVHVEGEIGTKIRKVIRRFQNRYYFVNRKEFALFGPTEQGTMVPVIKVGVPNALYELRSILEEIVESPSQFKVWNPHITLYPNANDTLHIPPQIRIEELRLR